MPSRPRFLFFSVALAFLMAVKPVHAQERPIVLKASTVLDGKGHILHNTILVIDGRKIARIGGAAPEQVSGDSKRGHDEFCTSG